MGHVAPAQPPRGAEEGAGRARRVGRHIPPGHRGRRAAPQHRARPVQLKQATTIFSLSFPSRSSKTPGYFLLPFTSLLQRPTFLLTKDLVCGSQCATRCLSVIEHVTRAYPAQREFSASGGGVLSFSHAPQGKLHEPSSVSCYVREQDQCRILGVYKCRTML
jgi:hypothetical protein